MWGPHITASLMHSCHVMESLISHGAYLGIKANTKRFTEQNEIIMEFAEPAPCLFFPRDSESRNSFMRRVFCRRMEMRPRDPGDCSKRSESLFIGVYGTIKEAWFSVCGGLGVILLLCMHNESQRVSFGLRA